MGKKSGFGFLGLAAAVGAAAAVIKYLRDYTDFKAAAEEEIHEFEDSTDELRRAAKRTYTSLSHRDTGELKEACGELAKAAGSAAKDVGSIAVAAGQSAAQHVRELKAIYDEDPDAAKSELVGNFRDMAAEVATDVGETVNRVSAKVSGKLRGDEALYEKEVAAFEEEMTEASAQSKEDDASEAETADGADPSEDAAGAEETQTPEPEEVPGEPGAATDKTDASGAIDAEREEKTPETEA